MKKRERNTKKFKKVSIYKRFLKNMKRNSKLFMKKTKKKHFQKLIIIHRLNMFTS